MMGVWGSRMVYWEDTYRLQKVYDGRGSTRHDAKSPFLSAAIKKPWLPTNRHAYQPA